MILVYVASLGLCEHCGILLSIEGIPADAMDAEWACPGCKGKLTHKSFGYATEKGGKIKWVGPEGKWVGQKPAEDFTLGNFEVYVRPMPAFI